MIRFSQLNEFVTNGSKGPGGPKGPKPPSGDSGGYGNQPHKPFKFAGHHRTPYKEDYYTYTFVDAGKTYETDVQVDNEYKVVGVFPRLNGNDDIKLSSEAIHILELIYIDARVQAGGPHKWHDYELSFETDSDDVRQRQMLSALAKRLK